MKMLHKLKFKSADLIKLVEERPTLWDRACTDYQNKLAKEVAWSEIYCLLYPNFQYFTREEQKILGDSITAKWRNLRDAFIRSVKRKSSAQHNYYVGKNYIYYEHLKFLLYRSRLKRNNKAKQTDVEYSVRISEEESFQNVVAPPIEAIEVFEPVESSRISPAAETDLSGPKVDEDNLSEPNVDQDFHCEQSVESPVQNRFMEGSHEYQQEQSDEDASFFTSITSTVRNFSEDEKLEFRIGTLELIRHIKRSRHATLPNHTHINYFNPNYSSYSSYGSGHIAVKQEVE